MKRLGAILRRHRRGVMAAAIAASAGLLIAWGCYLAWPPLGFIVAGLLLGCVLLIDFEQPRRAR